MSRIKDYFVNLYLEIRLWLHFKLKFRIWRRVFTNFTTLYPTPQSFLVEWRTGMPWGRVHPDYDHQIMTQSSVSEFYEEIRLSHLPFADEYIFPDGERKGEKVYPSIDCGVIYYGAPFKYGVFQISCILPLSDYAWPAFWLTGKDSWPPEIDWFEFMPKRINEKGRYLLSTNIHSNKAERSYGYRINEDIMDKEITFTGVWEKEYISFYYNGILIRKITNKKVIKAMDQEMILVIGTGASSDYERNIHYSNFKIKRVLYSRYV